MLLSLLCFCSVPTTIIRDRDESDLNRGIIVKEAPHEEWEPDLDGSSRVGYPSITKDRCLVARKH